MTRVYETVVTSDGVYFQTTEAVYRYRANEGIHDWYMGPKQLGKLFFVNERLLLKWHYKGIFELINDEWTLLPDSEQFGGVFVHTFFLLIGRDYYLALMFHRSISTMDNKFTLFESEVSNLSKRSSIILRYSDP